MISVPCRRSISISLIAKANAELDLPPAAAILRCTGSPRTGEGTKFRLSRSWDRYEIPLSIPAAPPDRAGGAYKAAFAFLIWLEAGPEHKDRTHNLGHQSGIFEFADIQIDGEAFDARVL